MLTPIEWWGGLIFVLGAICYRMTLTVLLDDEDSTWYTHLLFLVHGAVLAGYFYPLPQPAMQYAYAGITGLALALLLYNVATEFMSDDDEPDEEAGSLAYWILGYTVLYSPLVAACVLGGLKSWPLVQQWL